jgi:hypothetical protein
MSAKLAGTGVQQEFLTVPGTGHGLTGIDAAELKRINDRMAEFIKTHLG